MSRLATATADLLGVTVALLVAVFAFFHDVGVTTMAVRAGIAGALVAAIARLAVWSVSYMLNQTSETQVPAAAASGTERTPDITPGARTRRERE